MNAGLKEYLSEIESLIDQREIDAAITHCKHILRSYPKYIDVYRLLGKSFLENQFYKEASDIFTRILSVYPDDFVSLLGLSIISEENKIYDAAIWYMDRAYEIQPSNNAIKNELKRLYGIRDGEQPTNIYLSKGVLVRMYAKGKLFPQAIAEAQTALVDDPGRIDIETLLADLYYQSGENDKSVDIASKLLEKTPFNFIAHKILANTLPEYGKTKEAQRHQEIITSIDPYYKFNLVSYKSDLNFNEINIEKLELSNASSNYLKSSSIELQNEFENYQNTSQLDEILNETTLEKQEPFQNNEDTQQSSITDENITDLPIDIDNDSIDIVEEIDETIPDWLKQKSVIDEEIPYSSPDNNINAFTVDENDLLESLLSNKNEELLQDQKESNSSLASIFEVSSDDISAQFSTDEEKPNNEHETDDFLEDLHNKIDNNPDKDIQVAISDTAKFLSQTESSADNITNTPSPFIDEPIHDKFINKNAWNNEIEETTDDNDTVENDIDSKIEWLESLNINDLDNENEIISPPENQSVAPQEWLEQNYKQNIGTDIKKNGISTEDTNHHTGQIIKPDMDTKNDQDDILSTDEIDSLDDIPKLSNLESFSYNEDSIENEITSHLDISDSEWIKDDSIDSENLESQITIADKPINHKTDQIDIENDFISNNKNSISDIDNFSLEIPTIDIHKETLTEDTLERSELNQFENNISLSNNYDSTISDEIIENTESENKIDIHLQNARNALINNDLIKAINLYQELLENHNCTEIILDELNLSTEKYETNVSFWQFLGDLCAKNNRLQDALDAYTKAEKLLR